MRGSIAIAAALLCSACVSVPMVYPLVRAEAATVDSQQVRRTTPTNPILHRQRAVHSRFARLVQPLSVTDGSKAYNVSTEHLMYAAAMTGEDAPVFCTIEVTYVGRNAIGVEGRMPTCLRDESGDGRFDSIHSIGGLPFTRQFVNFSADIVPPAQYRIVDETNGQSVEFAIRFVPAAETAAQLQLVYTDGVFENPIERGAVAIPGQLPAVVTVMGAQVEVTAVEGPILTYRLLSGFDDDERVIDLWPY